MAKDVKNKIKNMGELWSKARETTKEDKGFGEFVPVEPGIYNMQLVDATIDTFGDRRKLLTKWCVVGDDDNPSAVCSQFDTIDDEERLVWLQRLLVAMGIDLDEVSIDNEDDLLDIFKGKVEEQLVCRVKVTEKEGFKNTRIQKVVEVDDSEKVDAEAVMKAAGGAKAGNKGSEKKSKGKEKEPEPDAEVSVEEGDRVSWENDDGNTVEGEIVGFADDGDAKVREDGQKKSVIKPLEALTKLEAAEEAPAEDEPVVIKKGMKVDHNGKSGVVTSVPPKGDQVQVTYDKTKKAAMVDRDELTIDEEVADEPEEAAAEEATIDVGSKVIATIKGKDQAGVVKSISDDGTTAKVKVGNQLIQVKVEDLAVEVDG